MKLIILGSGQDAGIPQAGCRCNNCRKAMKEPAYRRSGPSAAALDENNGAFYLIDASPYLKYQVEKVFEILAGYGLEDKAELKGILLTHAHLGHCYGLWNLGKEVMNTQLLPVYCTPSMKRFLASSHPFQALVEGKNINIIEIRPGEELKFEGFGCVPLEIPHRNEITDTVGYIISSTKRVLYIPDADRWTEKLLDEIRNADIALIDGTFYSKDELPRYDEVPHPSIKETMELLGEVEGRVIFTHINHTNPVNGDGEEKREVEGRGFAIGYDGMVLDV